MSPQTDLPVTALMHWSAGSEVTCGVLHHTVCDWLPVGEGILLFSEPEDVIDALSDLEGDYSRHAQAARVIAEGHFEASRVLRPMLEQAGFC